MRMRASARRARARVRPLSDREALAAEAFWVRAALADEGVVAVGKFVDELRNLKTGQVNS
jgi:hypothetical protein